MQQPSTSLGILQPTGCRGSRCLSPNVIMSTVTKAETGYLYMSGGGSITNQRREYITARYGEDEPRSTGRRCEHNNQK